MEPAMESPIQLRHDWYQTETDVVITILLKTHKPKEVTVKLAATTVDVTAQFDGHTDYTLRLSLYSTIVPERSTWKQFTSKIEIKLAKGEALRWNVLEKSPTCGGGKDSVASAAFGEQSHPSAAPSYPSSSVNKRDWDKIVVEIDRTEEEEEKNVNGEAAVNKLFQKIYSEGSEEVQRAMNKSFMESGGTVLSTNWKEVGQKPVEVKPPDGMEFKQWEH